MYQYKAVVVSVYDADTMTVDVDLGFGVWVRGQKLRLFGINAYEVRRSKAKGIGDDHVAKGKAGRDAVRAIVDRAGGEITIETIKDGKGKFGRWLAELWVQSSAFDDEPPPRGRVLLSNDRRPSLVSLNDWLVDAGHAWRQEY